MIRSATFIVTLGLLIVIVVASVSAQSQKEPGLGPTFTTIRVPFPGANGEGAFGINSADEIVGTYNTPDGLYHGFLLNQAGFTSIDVAGAANTVPSGINDHGQIVGYYADINSPTWISGNFHGFLRDTNGTVSVLNVPQSIATVAHGIDYDGLISGYYWTADAVVHGLLRDTNGQCTSIDFPGAIGTEAHSINSRGQIVGNYRRSEGSLFGFLLDKGEFVSAFKAAPQSILPYA